MGDTTKIQWTEHSWSPWFGCTKVHTGCTNCYAEADNKRYSRNGTGGWGKGSPRVVRKDWSGPMKWARAAAKAGERRKVFISLCDPLDEEAPKDAQDRLWDLIRDTANVCSICLDRGPNSSAAGGCWCEGNTRDFGLDWQLLTKRPERWELIPEDVRPLVWLGTSVSDQKTAREFISRLPKWKGFRYIFVSYEPGVGPVDLEVTTVAERKRVSEFVRETGQPDKMVRLIDGLDWVIVGGESGPGARPFNVAWARSILEQCKAAGVPCFVKQMGADVRTRNDDHLTGEYDGDPPGWSLFDDSQVKENVHGYREDYQGAEVRILLNDRKGGDWSEWPADLRVREFPEVRP